MQPSGTINPGDRYVGNRYVMSVDAHPPADRQDGSSPWGGMSGAALFCGDLLTGVIASDPAGFSHSRLEAVPAYVLMHDPDFRAALTEYSPEAGTVLEAVEWQDLGEDLESASTGGSLVVSPAALLRARRRVVPFRGRAHLLQRMSAWSQEPGFSGWLLHGPAGQGKTRLAQQLADLLAADGWATLWLRTDASVEALAVLAAAATPLLVVLDYAETRIRQLAAVLAAAARHKGGTPFKVLLLARTAGDWWTSVQADTATAGELLDGVPVAELEALEPDPGASRAQAFEQAVRGYAQYLPRVRGWQHHDWTALARSLPLPPMDRPGMESALTLHMTALVDLLDSAAPSIASADAVDADATQEVEDRLLLHERRYWNRVADTQDLLPSLTMGTLHNALAAALLVGSQDKGQADVLLERVPGLADQPRDRRDAVRDWISALYPPTDSTPWGTLQPDRLAERFIGRHLQREPDLADHIVVGATNVQAAQLLTIYARAAAHRILNGQLDQALTDLCVRHHGVLAAAALDVATQAESPKPLLDALYRIADAPDLSIPELQQLVDLVPLDTYPHLEALATHLAQHLADTLRGQAGDDPSHLPALAATLNDLSIRLAHLERSRQALEAATESVEINRKLARIQPDVHLTHLATSLNTLSNRQMNNHQLMEAKASLDESVKIYRKLVRAQPDVYLRDLIEVLINVSSRMWGDSGLAPLNEAVEMSRKLAQKRPDVHLPNLSFSLMNLSKALDRLKRITESLAADTEAAEIDRELARTEPDKYLPRLGAHLHNASVALGYLGRTEEGLAASTEAVEIYRKLARARPVPYRAVLATMLYNLSKRLGELERPEESLATITESVSIRRALAQVQKDPHLLDLAMSLHSLSDRLEELGRSKEAEAAFIEAVDIRDKLAQERGRPDNYLPDLRESVHTLDLLRGKAHPRFGMFSS